MAQLLKAIVDTQKNNYKAIGQVNAYDSLELELDIKMNGVNVEFVNPSFEFISKKADGNRVRQLKDISYADRKIKIIADEQITACSKTGIVSNQLIIKDEGRMSTCLFYFLLGSSFDREIIQSIDKVEVLEQLDEYVVTAFANLDEFEKRIITGEANIRKLNEDMTAAESNREEAETNRVNNESNRVSKEKERELAETERGSNEKNRKDSELVRVEAEKTREQQEDIRQRNYILKENERDDNYASAEIERNRAFNLEESKRARQEDVRGTNEIAREEAERNRTISESYRSDKESERVIAEKTRADNEAARIKNENVRETAETTRSRNEASRVEAEKTRVAEFEQIKKDNTTFKEGVTADYNAFTEEVENQILNSKTDYFGKEHTSVDERLNEDFDNIHQRVNNSEYLPYEGSNITADKTYYGLTKDMVVKGRTLQNLLEIRSNTDFNQHIPDSVSNGVITLNYKTGIRYLFIKKEVAMLKPRTKYTIKIEFINDTVNNETIFIMNGGGGSFKSTGYKVFSKQNGDFKTTLMLCETKEDLNDIAIKHSIDAYFDKITNGNISIRFSIFEGDYTNTLLSELPYVEGIQSVGDLVTDIESSYYGKYKVEVSSCGKNLFNTASNSFISGNINVVSGNISTPSKLAVISMPIKVKPNTSYSIKTMDDNVSIHKVVCFIDSDNYTDINSISSRYLCHRSFNSKECVFPNELGDSMYVIVAYSDINGTLDFNTDVLPYCKGIMQIEENTQATLHEPYVSDSKVYYLDETLKSLPNGVADEIKVNKLIKRIEKMVLDGLKNKVYLYKKYDNVCVYHTAKIENHKATNQISLISDILPSKGSHMSVDEGISQLKNYIYIRIGLSKTDEGNINNYLQSNPITVYYELAEPIIISLDEELTLKTFDTTTHITSNNYLLPTISAKVPSNVQAVVSGLRTENEALKTDLKIMNLVTEENNIKNIETNLDQEARLTMIEMGVI